MALIILNLSSISWVAEAVRALTCFCALGALGLVFMACGEEASKPIEASGECAQDEDCPAAQQVCRLGACVELEVPNPNRPEDAGMVEDVEDETGQEDISEDVSEDVEEDTFDEDPNVVLGPQTHRVDQETMRAIEVMNDGLVLQGEKANWPEAYIGAIWLSTDRERPFLRRITRLQPDGDALVAYTQPASLVEAFETLHIDTEDSEEKAELSAILEFAFDNTFDAEAGPLSIEGGVSLSFIGSFRFRLDIEFFKLKRLEVVFEVSLAFDNSMELVLGEDFDLAEQTLLTVPDIVMPTIFVGPVPITPVLEGDLEFELEALVGLAWAWEQRLFEIFGTAGFTFEDGQWDTIKDLDGNFLPGFGGLSELEASILGRFIATLSIPLSLDLRLFGAAGPGLVFSPFVELVADVEPRLECLEVETSWRAGIGVEAEVEIELPFVDELEVDFSLAEFSVPLETELFDSADVCCGDGECHGDETCESCLADCGCGELRICSEAVCVSCGNVTEPCCEGGLCGDGAVCEEGLCRRPCSEEDSERFCMGDEIWARDACGNETLVVVCPEGCDVQAARCLDCPVTDCDGGLACGLVEDGCGGQFDCGGCENDMHCNPDNRCRACPDNFCTLGGQPNGALCDGDDLVLCGLVDGCVEVLGRQTCGEGRCDRGTCIGCVPDCLGRVCGNDGCNGSCGRCERGVCSTLGACLEGDVCGGGGVEYFDHLHRPATVVAIRDALPMDNGILAVGTTQIGDEEEAWLGLYDDAGELLYQETHPLFTEFSQLLKGEGGAAVALGQSTEHGLEQTTLSSIELTWVSLQEGQLEEHSVDWGPVVNIMLPGEYAYPREAVATPQGGFAVLIRGLVHSTPPVRPYTLLRLSSSGFPQYEYRWDSSLSVNNVAVDRSGNHVLTTGRDLFCINALLEGASFTQCFRYPDNTAVFQDIYYSRDGWRAIVYIGDGRPTGRLLTLDAMFVPLSDVRIMAHGDVFFGSYPNELLPIEGSDQWAWRNGARFGLMSEGGLILSSSHFGITGRNRFDLEQSELLAWRGVHLARLSFWSGSTDCEEAGLCAGLSFSACDDGNPCTADLCDSGGGCIHEFLGTNAACGVEGQCEEQGCVER